MLLAAASIWFTIRHGAEWRDAIAAKERDKMMQRRGRGIIQGRGGGGGGGSAVKEI